MDKGANNEGIQEQNLPDPQHPEHCVTKGNSVILNATVIFILLDYYTKWKIGL